jgi:hypothetical protein
VNRAARRRNGAARQTAQPSAFAQVHAIASSGPLAFGMPRVQLPVEGRVRPRGPQPAAAEGLAPVVGPAIPSVPGTRWVRLDLAAPAPVASPAPFFLAECGPETVDLDAQWWLPAPDPELAAQVREATDQLYRELPDALADERAQARAQSWQDDTAEYVLRDVHQPAPQEEWMRPYAPAPEPPSTRPRRGGLPALLDELHAVDEELYEVPLGTAPLHEAALAHVEWSPDEEAAVARARRMLLDGADASRVAAALEAFVAQQDLLAGAR